MNGKKRMNKKQMNTMTLYRRGILLALGVVLAVPAPAFAEVSLPQARTQEEWARLRDNRIEWDELRDLVHEYNPTIATAWLDFAEEDRNGAYNIDYDEALQSIENAYEKAYTAANGDEVNEALALVSYDTSMARTTVDSSRQDTDREAAVALLNRSEVKMTETIRKSLIGIYTSEIQLQLDQITADYNRTLYDSAVRRQAVGRATRTDVLSAEETMKNAEVKLQADQQTARKTKQLLQVNLGWKHDASPEFCEIPMVTDEMLAAMDLTRDTEKALETNFTLRADERKRAVSETDSSIDQLTVTIDNDRENIRSDMIARSEAVIQAKNTLEQQKLSLSNLRTALDKAQRNYNVGAVSLRALEGAQYQVSAAELQLKLQEYALAMAYYDYVAGMNGIATAVQGS